MILVLKQKAKPEAISQLSDQLHSMGFVVQEIKGEHTHMLGLAGDTSHIDRDQFGRIEIVDSIMKVSEPYKLAGRKFHPEDTIIDVNGRKIGGGNFVVMAGPCSVESEEQILSVARDVKASGASFIRGGAFKPRTSPYAFQGLGLDGLELLKMARQKTGLPVVTELMNNDYLEEFARDVDIIQIGARNMQNFSLLREVGQLKKPVLLKRGLANTIEELLMAAEYLMRTRHPHLRNSNPQHAGSVGGSCASSENPPAGNRRPLSRHWLLAPGRAHGAGGCCRRRRRPYYRGSQRSTVRSVRWPAVADPGGVSPADAAHRTGKNGTQRITAGTNRLSQIASFYCKCRLFSANNA